MADDQHDYWVLSLSEALEKALRGSKKGKGINVNFQTADIRNGDTTANACIKVSVAKRPTSLEARRLSKAAALEAHRRKKSEKKRLKAYGTSSPMPAEAHNGTNAIESNTEHGRSDTPTLANKGREDNIPSPHSNKDEGIASPSQSPERETVTSEEDDRQRRLELVAKARQARVNLEQQTLLEYLSVIDDLNEDETGQQDRSCSVTHVNQEDVNAAEQQEVGEEEDCSELTTTVAVSYVSGEIRERDSNDDIESVRQSEECHVINAQDYHGDDW